MLSVRNLSFAVGAKTILDDVSVDFAAGKITAILGANGAPKHLRTTGEGLADGIVVTPSHNPPRDGGFKYNPPHGGPADSDATSWIAKRANEILEKGWRSVGFGSAGSPQYPSLRLLGLLR